VRTFGLTDEAFAALAAGRPSPETLAELRRAQISRHLLLLSTIKTPLWYERPTAPRRAATVPGSHSARTTQRTQREARLAALADPMNALHTAASVAAHRAGAAPPPEPSPSPRHLTATHDGLTLDVRLEDTDPLRERLGLTPSPLLTDPELAEWQRLFTAAWHLLVTRHRETAATLAEVLRVLIPIRPDPGSSGLSATSAEAFGAVAISTPADPSSLAVGLIHETQHSLLNATRTLFDLVTPGAPLTCSLWRDDPRPPFGLLHGAYAYQAVTRFWRTEPGRLAQFEFARWRAAVVTAADALLAGAAQPTAITQPSATAAQRWLTPAGDRFVRAMRAEVAAWQDDPVDPDIERLALGANLEHRVRWRLRNLVVDVEELADDWRAGRAARIPAARLREGAGRALEHSERLELVHRVVKGDPGLQPAGRQRPGDDAYLRGEARAALDSYLIDLETAETDDVPVWCGIALVGPWECVRERPEVVRALYRYFGNIRLEKIADWLGESR
jgi:HEXXH motif-containing protein